MSNDLFNLSNKRVLITGASKGMGKAMATALMGYGAHVVISSRKQDQIEACAEELKVSTGNDNCLCSGDRAGNQLREFAKIHHSNNGNRNRYR